MKVESRVSTYCGHGFANPVLRLGMFCFSIQQIQRVREQVCNGLQRFHGAAGTARQIEDESLAAYSAYTAAEGGEGSFFRAFEAHALADAVDETVTDRFGGFGRDVARRNPRAAGSCDELRFEREVDEGVLNLHGIVLHDSGRHHTKTELLENVSDSRS